MSTRALELRTTTDAERSLTLCAPPRGDATGLTAWLAGVRFVAVLALADLSPVILAIAFDPTVAVPAVVVGVVAVAVWRSLGLYARRFTLSALDDLPRVLLGLAVGLGAAACLGAWIDTSGVTVLAATAVLGVPVGRAVAYRIELGLRRTGRTRPRRVAILGYGPIASGVAQRFRERPDLGAALVGQVTAGTRPQDTVSASVGTLEFAAAALRLTDVVITAADLTPDLLADVCRTCDAHHIDMHVVARFPEPRWPGPVGDHLWGIPVHSVRSPRNDAGARAAKRVVDIVLATTAMAASSPVLLAVAVAVRCEGGPGVIFKQQRVGQGGRIFTVYKFRSLRPDSLTESDTTWSIADDPRLGPVGRFIRRTSIDELPQLVNVLKGEMSLVGPRPERPRFVDQYAASVPHYADRHRVPVGLTGLAAVHGLRGNTSIRDRAVFDNVYIENWSLWFDLKIILRTLGEVLRGRGA